MPVRADRWTRFSSRVVPARRDARLSPKNASRSVPVPDPVPDRTPQTPRHWPWQMTLAASGPGHGNGNDLSKDF
jgi:hypothetical protein